MRPVVFRVAAFAIVTATLSIVSAQPPGRGKQGADQDGSGPGAGRFRQGPAGGGFGAGPGGTQRGGGPGGGGMGARMMRMMPLFIAIDKDGDGALSANEINGAVAAILSLDKNKNGIVDADELAPDRSRMGGGRGAGGPGGQGGPGGNKIGKGQGPGDRFSGGPGGRSGEEGGKGPGGFRRDANQDDRPSGATRPKRPSTQE